MAREKPSGFALLAVSAAGVIAYGALLYYYTLLILEITAFTLVIFLLGILGWIGWTMFTAKLPEQSEKATQETNDNVKQPALADKRILISRTCFLELSMLP